MDEKDIPSYISGLVNEAYFCHGYWAVQKSFIIMCQLETWTTAEAQLNHSMVELIGTLRSIKYHKNEESTNLRAVYRSIGDD